MVLSIHVDTHFSLQKNSNFLHVIKIQKNKLHPFSSAYPSLGLGGGVGGAGAHPSCQAAHTNSTHSLWVEASCCVAMLPPRVKLINLLLMPLLEKLHCRSLFSLLYQL